MSMEEYNYEKLQEDNLDLTTKLQAAEDRVVTLRTCTGNLTSDLLAVTKSRDEFQRLASLRERERDTLQAEVARLKETVSRQAQDYGTSEQLRQADTRIAELEAELADVSARFKLAETLELLEDQQPSAIRRTATEAALRWAFDDENDSKRISVWYGSAKESYVTRGIASLLGGEGNDD